MARSYWRRLGERAERVGVLETIENPATVTALAAIWTLGAAINSVFIALIFFAFDEPVAGWVSAGLLAFYLGGWVLFATSGRVRLPFTVLVVASLVALITMQWLLGGYANSGGTFFWSIGLSLVMVLLLSRTATVVGVVLVVAVAISFGFLEQSLQGSRAAPDPALPAIMFPYTLVAIVLLIAPVMALLVGRLNLERERAEGLLLNVLPSQVATELKTTGATAPRHFDAISVLFADIVGFTPRSAGMDPDELVASLNEVFTAFDGLVRKHGAEKIRTIGDNYMVAAGVPLPRPDHAEVLAALALEMLDYAATSPWSFRIGINSGPAIAGVLGVEKFQYDLWGDAVTTASRMESHGEPGRVQITEATNELIEDAFATTPRGSIEVKGKGTMTTYWLDGPAATTARG